MNTCRKRTFEDTGLDHVVPADKITDQEPQEDSAIGDDGQGGALPIGVVFSVQAVGHTFEHPHLCFETLSQEIWMMILSHLSKPVLRKLCLVSRRFRSLVIPAMYREVDLSTHRKAHLHQKFHFSQSVARRQLNFLKTVLKRPEWALHTRSFTWTMGLIGHKQRVTGFEKSQEYCLLALLNRVVHVDIDCGPRHDDPLMQLPTLFPAATQIILGGKMHYALASAILHGRAKAPLTKLVLNNVQEGGLLESGDNFFICRWLELLPFVYNDIKAFEEDWPRKTLPRAVAPGVMRRILTGSLVERCKNLTELSLRKQGQQHEQQLYPSSWTHEDEVYQEWADFIIATKPRRFKFSHGGHTEAPWNGELVRSCIPPPPELQWRDPSPMDERFTKFLLPVLAKGWNGLEELQIEGVKLNEGIILAGPGVKVIMDGRITPCWNACVGDP